MLFLFFGLSSLLRIGRGNGNKPKTDSSPEARMAANYAKNRRKKPSRLIYVVALGEVYGWIYLIDLITRPMTNAHFGH